MDFFGNSQMLLGIVAGVIAFSAYLIYIVSILRGETKPSRATWWIWTFMGLVLAISYYFSGASNTIWVPVVEFVGPLSIALLSLKYGEGGLDSKSDLVCLFGAFASIVLWLVFDSPVVALVTNLAIDSFALFPTIRKSLERPEDENFWAWFGTLTADAMNLFAVEKLTFAILVYPVYMFVSDVIVVGVLGWKKGGRLGPVFAQRN